MLMVPEGRISGKITEKRAYLKDFKLQICLTYFQEEFNGRQANYNEKICFKMPDKITLFLFCGQLVLSMLLYRH